MQGKARTVDEIEQLVATVNGSATLQAAADALGVSRETLGRDCRRLRKDGWEIRLFDGAKGRKRPGPPCNRAAE